MVAKNVNFPMVSFALMKAGCNRAVLPNLLNVHVYISCLSIFLTEHSLNTLFLIANMAECVFQQMQPM